MKNALNLILMTMMIQNYVFASSRPNNIFTGKTQPSKGVAAIAVVIAVDESVLKKEAIANGKSQCFDAGFSYCYAINGTYSTVQDASGFYSKILVEGFHEVPEKYKPVPVKIIPAPAGSLCYFEDARGFGSDPIYRVHVSYDNENSAEELNTFEGYSLQELFLNLNSQGVCERYKITTSCGKKWFSNEHYCN